MAKQRLVTVAQVIRMLGGCSKAGLYKMIREGKFPKSIKVDGLGVRFWRIDVDKYFNDLREKERVSPPEK
jgi:predicted DNA-binding transcriptional regulator AlpA